jgi:hypothetical protein
MRGAMTDVAGVRVPLKIAFAIAARSIPIDSAWRTRLSSKRSSYVGRQRYVKDEETSSR